MVEHLLIKFQCNILFIMQLQVKANYYWVNYNYNSVMTIIIRPLVLMTKLIGFYCRHNMLSFFCPFN